MAMAHPIDERVRMELRDLAPTRLDAATDHRFNGGGALNGLTGYVSLRADQSAWLHEHVGPDLRPLFAGGLTRGGHGVGLGVCADFVAASCGLSPAAALEHGHLGARCENNVFDAWFHWPAFVPVGETPPVCAC